MPRWNGGIIGPDNIPTEFVASGMWSIEEVKFYLEQNLWPTGGTAVDVTGVEGTGAVGGVSVTATVSDPYFENTVLLLPGNGTNGAQNNTFLDSSTNNFTITRNGNTTQGTFSPFSKPAGRWGNYFDGTGDYLRCGQNTNAAFTLGTSNFTFEAFVYLTQYNGSASFIGCQNQSTGSAGVSFGVYITAAGLTGMLAAPSSSGYVFNTTGTTVALNTWTHIAATRNGNTFTLWKNGVSDISVSASVTISQDSIASGYGGWNIAASPITGQAHYGYISNARLVNGTAVYTTTFTPPTAPLTAISGTSLLTCQSSRFIDNSTNNFAITVNGNTAITPFSPFPITTEYSPSVNGGSGYFDGTGDYLTFPNNTAFAFGTGAFTIEFWINASLNSDKFILGGRSAIGTMHITTGGFSSTAGVLRYVGSSTIVSSNVITDSSWHHCAIVRNGSNNITLYVDGVSVGTGTDSTNYTQTSGTWYIARNDSGDTGYLTGYLFGLRIVKGTAVYTTAFTPPTAPLTAISGTSLLASFTNAGIIDNTCFNDLETVGNAQIDTAVSKFGTGSIEFDGTTDYVVQPISDTYGYGTGDFTIEFWLYLNSTGLQTIVSNLSSASSTNPHIYISTTIRYFTVNADRITGASLSTSQWYHIAVCRASGSTRLFIDGTQSGSTYSDTNNYGATAPLGIGTYWNSGAPVTTNTLNGYIDDLRITKGIARYTSNFTPPTAPFPLFG